MKLLSYDKSNDHFIIYINQFSFKDLLEVLNENDEISIVQFFGADDIKSYTTVDAYKLSKIGELAKFLEDREDYGLVTHTLVFNTSSRDLVFKFHDETDCQILAKNDFLDSDMIDHLFTKLGFENGLKKHLNLHMGKYLLVDEKGRLVQYFSDFDEYLKSTRYYP